MLVPSLLPSLLFLTALLFPTQVASVKFSLPASRWPHSKCLWNTAHTNTLVVITAIVSPGVNQRVDVDVIDSLENTNVLLSRKGINGEVRLAVTTHSDGEIGVCFRNHVEGDADKHLKLERTVDLDVDIGAEAVDYNAIANQESLSTLETEMRKLEGLVREISDELAYLKQREERFTDTNLSTNIRVQNFAWFTLFSLASLGVWQIFHLRAYFRRKYLID